VKVAHVLIKTDSRPDEAALRMAQDIARRARAGEDFARLAREYFRGRGQQDNRRRRGMGQRQAPAASTDPKQRRSRMRRSTSCRSSRARRCACASGRSATHSKHLRLPVIKAVEEREFRPDAAPAKARRSDPSDGAVPDGSRLPDCGGIFSEAKLKARVQTYSAWLRGYLAEQDPSRGCSRW